MKLHFDENTNVHVAYALRLHGVDVTTTAEAGLTGQSDESQLAYALAQNRVVVSHDRDMLVLAASGHPHAGIAYCPMGKYKIGPLMRRLMKLTIDPHADPMAGIVEYL